MSKWWLIKVVRTDMPLDMLVMADDHAHAKKLALARRVLPEHLSAITEITDAQELTQLRLDHAIEALVELTEAVHCLRQWADATGLHPESLGDIGMALASVQTSMENATGAATWEELTGAAPLED